MVASQNGWRANDRSVISTRTVPGTSVRLAVRNGAPGDLLLELAARYHRQVESIEGTGDNWGYAERNIRGSSTTVSNHASGTAIDLRASRHPLGTDPRANFTAEQIAACNRLTAACGGAVRWGGTYSGRKDGMHWELADGSTEASCAAALARLRGTDGLNPAPAPVQLNPVVLRLGSTGPEVEKAQRVLNAWYPTLKLQVDGKFGLATENAIKHLQANAGLTVDGVVGPKTRAVLHL